MALRRTKRLERVNEVADLIRQGLSQIEIARRLGISTSRVGQIRCAHGLSGPNTSLKVRNARRTLSRRQARILRFVGDFTERHPYPPTIEEITRGCSISSRSVTHYNLTILERRGYMTRAPLAARTIVLTRKGRSKVTR